MNVHDFSCSEDGSIKKLCRTMQKIVGFVAHSQGCNHCLVRACGV